MWLGIAAAAIVLLGPPARNGYIALAVEQCAAREGFAAAPWHPSSDYGFYGFDATSSWIIGETRAERDLIACVRSRAGLVIEVSPNPFPVLEHSHVPYLEKVHGDRLYRYFLHAGRTTAGASRN